MERFTGEKADSAKEHKFFDRSLTPIVKGIAIILMFALHLLKPEWMLYPELVKDIHIEGITLSAIMSRGGDICIGVFAFVTGYGWAGTFNRKRRLGRVLGIEGGGYLTYWIILVMFSFPMRILFTAVVEKKMVHLSALEVVKSLTAISSDSVMFGWYIYFFALAVFTYPFLVKVVDGIEINGIVLVYMICFVFLVLRFMTRILFARIINDDALGILSHYFQWMPVVLTGHIVHKRKLFDRVYERISERLTENGRFIICLIGSSAIYTGKCFFMFSTGIYSNFDSLVMLPFMFFILQEAVWINSRKNIIRTVLVGLGNLSMYLWLTHSVMLYQPVQRAVFHLRYPLLILCASFIVMAPIALGIRKVDEFIRIRVKKI